jgi:hypothetical protein
LPDGKSVTISVKVSEDDAAALDRARGGASRSAWLQRIINAELGRTAGTAEFVAGIEQENRRIAGQSRPRPASTEPGCPHPKASVIKGRCTRCQTFVGF